MLLVAVAFAGCDKKEAQEASKATQTAPAAPAQPGQQLVLVDFGPKATPVGKDFNIQPNGESALWAKAENVTPSTVIVLNNVQMKSNPKKEGNAITCFVPKSAYSAAGEYPVFLLDTKTGSKSNELKLVVK
ncbi:hypothetical protein KP004_14810 [Geomonas oryzisoli]|uniref:Lipoprotein n=1 Tax=Geomonas oryzisoli TaxID=2847992 RepID=A0ABX8J291_9BACT|nr:hypothetical protein [Geomonas oryzisoli]QWV92464.1 hypothetical protein KP004_14810 [Geomonas oryzisoli]